MAKVQYWLKITFVFILILFIDSVNRVYRVQLELAVSAENAGASVYAPQSTNTWHLESNNKKDGN